MLQSKQYLVPVLGSHGGLSYPSMVNLSPEPNWPAAHDGHGAHPSYGSSDVPEQEFSRNWYGGQVGHAKQVGESLLVWQVLTSLYCPTAQSLQAIHPPGADTAADWTSERVSPVHSWYS